MAIVRYFMGSLLGVTKKNSVKPIFLQVIGRSLLSGNSRTQITTISSAIHSLFDIMQIEKCCYLISMCRHK